MRQKTALRRLCKLLPMPHELDDLIASEEEDEPAAPAPVTPPRRIRGAADALEQFAGPSEPAPSETAGQPEPPDEQTQTQVEQLEIAPIRLETAHRRGVEARAEGLKRTAIPAEYREANRQSEAAAWRAGWDGQTLENGPNDAAT